MLPVPGVLFPHGAAVVHSDVDPTLREHLKSLLSSDGGVLLSDTVLRGEDLSGRIYEVLYLIVAPLGMKYLLICGRFRSSRALR